MQNSIFCPSVQQGGKEPGQTETNFFKRYNLYKSLYEAFVLLQDRDNDSAQLVETVSWRHGGLHTCQEDRGGCDPQGRGPDVDLLPVHDQRGAPEDPHRDAHHHLQEDLW